MEISILTQNNHFLINRAVYSLVKRLHNVGYDIVVFRCSATPRGRSANKLSSAKEIFNLMGFKFFSGVVLSYFMSMLCFSDQRLRRIARIVEIGDNQRLGADLFSSHTNKSQALLIVSGTRIIEKDVLDFFSANVINVHSSLLPYSKGLMPAFWTYHKKMGRGVSLFRLDEGIDSGEIIYQVPIENPGKSYLEYLFQTKIIGIDLLLMWVFENLLKCKAQVDIESSYNKYPTSRFGIEKL